jgi:hypothetical protein
MKVQLVIIHYFCVEYHSRRMIAIMRERERSECSRLDPKNFSHNIRWRKTKSTARADLDVERTKVD